MYYKDKQNNIHVLDSSEFDYLLPTGCIQITDEEAEAITSAIPVPPMHIQSISPRQIRQALTRAGLRESVEVAVAAGDNDLKDWWEFSTSYDRLNPQVVGMGELLGQTDEKLDALWLLGHTL